MKVDNFFSFLIGLGIGIASGVLYAPDKGENTRRRLTYQLDKYKKQLEKYVKDYYSDEDQDKPKSESAKITDETVQQAKSLIKQVEDLTSKVQEK